jgi:hypothetical protein
MGHLARQCYNNQHPCPHEERRCEVKSSLSVRAPVITGMGEWNGWSAVRHLEVSYDGGVVHDGPEVSYSGMRALRKQKGGLLPRFLRETLAQPPAGAGTTH